MSLPRLPPEWDDWHPLAQVSHLEDTRNRAELHAAILSLLGLPAREFRGEVYRRELAAILVALLAASAQDPSAVVFREHPRDDREEPPP